MVACSRSGVQYDGLILADVNSGVVQSIDIYRGLGYDGNGCGGCVCTFVVVSYGNHVIG